MIYSLTGILKEAMPGQIVIECSGVGYLISMPATDIGALPPIGDAATVYTHMNVTENDVSLYGFANRTGREMFLMLTTVSGVGPKAGLAVLSALTPDQIVLAVSAGDHKAFTAAQGIGPKIAQRLVLELRDKVAKGIAAGGLNMQDVAAVSSPAAQGAPQQAVAALITLGYTQSEAASAVAGIDAAQPVSEIIRLALKAMGGA